jgi:hypothetical protein
MFKAIRGINAVPSSLWNGGLDQNLLARETIYMPIIGSIPHVLFE